MKRVKDLTTGQTIIMGRKTLESIGHALTNRINRVLTRNPKSLQKYENIEVFTDDAILDNISTDKAYIFGGAEIYTKYFDKCDELFITEVDAIVNADAKFPNFNQNDWELINKQTFKKDKDNEYNYSFLHYRRK